MNASYFTTWKCACGSESFHFDRLVCACGMMHNYCDGCGQQADLCWDNEDEHELTSTELRDAFLDGLFDLRILVPAACLGLGIIIGTLIA